tara:strand:+ start:313 stop:615 length:303 start_codon:yes stop_codon:yes gene_type:complete
MIYRSAAMPGSSSGPGKAGTSKSSPSTPNSYSDLGAMGLGFIVVFLISFLVAIAFVRRQIQSTPTLNQDREATIRRYNQPRRPGPRVGDVPASQDSLELD